jgi:hypothetical protein
VDRSLVVSIAALVIAGGSLAIAIRADRRAGRAEARGLRAEVVVEPSASSSDPKGRRFPLGVRNVGSGVARNVHVWLEDEAGRIVSSIAGGEGLTLVPNDDPVVLGVVVSDASLPPPPVTYSVFISWSDGAGEHERVDARVSVST